MPTTVSGGMVSTITHVETFSSNGDCWAFYQNGIAEMIKNSMTSEVIPHRLQDRQP